jgi:MtN3 and saliva related transmembrane protein
MQSFAENFVSGVAATLTTAAFLPQAARIIRHRDTKAISLLMYLVFTVGVAFWLAFGVMIWNWPSMIANAVTLVLAIVIVALKLRFG